MSKFRMVLLIIIIAFLLFAMRMICGSEMVLSKLRELTWY